MANRKIRIREKPFFVDGKVAIPYNYSAGRAGSRFLIGLRDEKKIRGLSCPKCKKVYVPPRSTCKDCFGLLSEWVDVSDEGTLQTFTVVRQQNDAAQPVKVPFAYGIIKLDGADTGFVHMLGGVNLESIRIGMRVKAVFKTKRTASILDINYFEPVK